MATMPISEQLWTVEQYLASSWSPDREFVDGRIEERNVGEKEHSIIQRFLTVLFDVNRDEWDVEVYPELRAQVASANFRVPDLLVINSSEDFEHYLKRPPLIAFEILSSEDTLKRLEDKFKQYLAFGVQHIWIIDPEKRQAYQYSSNGAEEVTTGELVVPHTPIRVPLARMFAELDRKRA